MLDFICPSCKTSWQAANEFAGKSILCPKCGQSVTAPEVADAAPNMKNGGAATSWVRIGVYAVLGVAVFVVLAALLVPSVRISDANMTRMQSINNLKQIALACQAYHDVNKYLPTATTVVAAANNGLTGSAHFQILPHIDQNPAFVAGTSTWAFPVFQCPGRGRPTSPCWTDYDYNLWLNDATAGTLLKTNSKRTLATIQDGTANTIGFGHGAITVSDYSAAANFAGSSDIFAAGAATTYGTFLGTATVTFRRDGDYTTTTIGSWGGPFSQGGLFAMLDGSVHMFPFATQNLGAFLTPDGDEKVKVPD